MEGQGKVKPLRAFPEISILEDVYLFRGGRGIAHELINLGSIIQPEVEKKTTQQQTTKKPRMLRGKSFMRWWVLSNPHSPQPQTVAHDRHRAKGHGKGGGDGVQFAQINR